MNEEDPFVEPETPKWRRLARVVWRVAKDMPKILINEYPGMTAIFGVMLVLLMIKGILSIVEALG